MKNITLAIDDNLLETGRAYAKSNHTTINALVRKLLTETLQAKSTEWIDDLFSKADHLPIPSPKNKKWTRESLYEI